VIDLARALAPDPTALVAAVAVDLLLGDPVYPAHPVRLIGRTLQWFEGRLRAAGLDGYGGGNRRGREDETAESQSLTARTA